LAQYKQRIEFLKRKGHGVSKFFDNCLNLYDIENGPGIGAESPHAGGLAAKARFMAPEKTVFDLCWMI
jgi:hypothetical protein